MLYTTPSEYLHRCAFSRFRFSSDFESALSLFVSLICEIGSQEKTMFNNTFDHKWETIAKEKTGANHRTEMTRLLGLTIQKDGMITPSERCRTLSESQDFPLFFKTLCMRFQFPNGINKPQVTSEYIQKGIRFKPAKKILMVMRKGKEIIGSDFHLTSNEAAHFIFNDLRVTTDKDTIDTVIQRIIHARENHWKLKGGSKHTQHAREFLNYMALGNLLRENDRKFTINEKEEVSIQQILQDETFFEFHDDFLHSSDKRKEYIDLWQEWYGGTTKEESRAMATPDNALLADDDTNIREAFNGIWDSPDLKEIGDAGERIVYGLEKVRVAQVFPEKLPLVKIVSNDTSLGYDIQSINNDINGTKRYIEVKTTKRIHKPTESAFLTYFDMSSNEWETAVQQGDYYFVYRVFLTSAGYKIFIVQNPAQKEAEGKLRKIPLKYRVVLQKDSGIFLEGGVS